MSDLKAAKKEVRVHIDQRPYISPTPTTGVALYELGHVASTFVLYREVKGDREDVQISRDALEVHLSEDEHLHSGSPGTLRFEIIVNTEPKTVEKSVLLFHDVVKLAYPAASPSPTRIYTVTYKKAVAPMHQGSLVAGGTVEVKNGTIFNVTETDKS
jgi:hypothetical protein